MNPSILAALASVLGTNRTFQSTKFLAVIMFALLIGANAIFKDIVITAEYMYYLFWLVLALIVNDTILKFFTILRATSKEARALLNEDGDPEINIDIPDTTVKIKPGLNPASATEVAVNPNTGGVVLGSYPTGMSVTQSMPVAPVNFTLRTKPDGSSELVDNNGQVVQVSLNSSTVAPVKVSDAPRL